MSVQETKQEYFLQRLSLFYQRKKNLYEKYAGGTKLKIHGTIVTYWVQNTHGKKWFWYDMTIIPEDIRKYMINREKYCRQEFKIL